MGVWSRYNYLFTRDNVYFLYNSLSNSFAELDKDLYLLLKNIVKGQPVNGLSGNAITALSQMRAIVEDDEVDFLRIKHAVQSMRFQDAKLSLTICPTLACNFRCPYCFENGHPNITMDDKTETDIVTFVKSHNKANNISVTWFGGEPLLAFDRVASLSLRLMELEPNYTAMMVTNGYLLTDKIARKLRDLKIGNLQITLDGLESTHNQRRFLSNGGGTFNKILENIKTVSKISPETSISIRVNIDGHNCQEFVSLFNFFKSMNLPNLHVHPAFVSEYGAGCSGYSLDSGSRRDLLYHYSKLTSQSFLQYYPIKRRSECAVRNRNTYVIGPEGEIYKCWNDVGNPAKIVADIRGNIVNEALMLRYLCGADPLEDVKCKECVLQPVCSGGCPYERLRQTCESDLCPLLKTNLDDFLWHKYIQNQQIYS